MLFVAVMAVMLAFRSSQKLATAYGVSVTGALVVDTILLLLVARVLWHWQPWKLALAAIAFGAVELTFLAANLSKVVHGGWLPLGIAVTVFTIMTTWRHGRSIVMKNRHEKEGSLQEFVDDVRRRHLTRVPGTAVFPHPGKQTTPLALRANTDYNSVLHEAVIIVSSSVANVPHVPVDQRFTVDDLGFKDDGIQHIPGTGGVQRRHQPARGTAPGLRVGRAHRRAGPARQRVVLSLPRHDPAVEAARHGALAQGAVRRHGPQRRPTRPPCSTCRPSAPS